MGSRGVPVLWLPSRGPVPQAVLGGAEVRSALEHPAGVFGPVWTMLYTLMGIAAFLVRRQESADIRARRALSAFRAQLVLNGL